MTQHIDFFAVDEVNALIARQSVIVFKGEDYSPLLFFSYVITSWRFEFCQSVQQLDVANSDPVDIQLNLETSFLGMQAVYWLKGFDQLDEKKKKRWYGYLQHYTGPHKIVMYIPESECASLQFEACVKFPTICNHETYNAIMQLLAIKPSQASINAISRLFKRVSQISFEAAYVLVQYMPVMSAANQEEIDDFFDYLVGSEHSLFTLSTYFFAGQRDQFFLLWSRVYEKYNDIFWVTFWSEQLWRAAHFVFFSQKRAMPDAKKIGYRLPFSFMQKDWKLHTLKNLSQAHDQLYAIDFALKNGAAGYPLEEFFVSYFNTIRTS